jgi:hypothetical protein
MNGAAHVNRANPATMNPNTQRNARNLGTVVAVRGTVVDVGFNRP